MFLFRYVDLLYDEISLNSITGSNGIILKFSLNFRMLSKVHGCASNGHCNICLVDSWACPHLHAVFPLKYVHLFRCCLLHVIPVHNLLRHIDTLQRLVIPFAKLSSRLTVQLCDVKYCGS